MWIVKIALSRPYTFLVMAAILLILGPLTILRTPTDIFPNIGIPVLSMIWQYTGLPAREMANRITANFERVLPVVVNGVDHIDSTNLNGIAVSKVFFHPDANIPLAMSQATAGVNYYSRNFPQGNT